MPLFSGEYSSTLDDKNRVIIPSDLRKAAGRAGEAGYYVTRGLDACVAIYTAERFEEIGTGATGERSRLSTAGRMLERALFANARSASCDKQGRLRIPPALTERLEIDREVVIVGVNDRIEVWDKARWSDMLAQAEAELEGRADEVYGRGREGQG